VSAYRAIAAEEGDLYLAGGTESLSNVPYAVKGARWGLKLRHSEFTDMLWDGLTDPVCGLIMGATAENLAERYEISREEQDEFAVNSHKKAFRAQRMDKFKDEIVAVEIVKRVGGQEVARELITQDEGVNPTLST
ncbi:MAG: acetyl-CoA C-acyltransferase, partial [Anaerolineae bacterium]|nr:acetyl-CoA C-acyltransferase [Anaerolineae bacterium]